MSAKKGHRRPYHPRSSSGSSLTSSGSNPSSFNRSWKFLWRRSSRSSNNNEDDDDDDDAVDDDILVIMKQGVPCGLLLFCLFGIICCFPPLSFVQRYRIVRRLFLRMVHFIEGKAGRDCLQFISHAFGFHSSNYYFLNFKNIR